MLQHFADLVKLYRPEYVSEEEFQFAKKRKLARIFKFLLDPKSQQDPYLKHIVDKVTACFVADDCPEPLRSYAFEQLNLKS